MEDTFPVRLRFARAAMVPIVVFSITGAQGCSNFAGTTAASFLRRIQDDPDPNVRYVAYSKLAKPNCYDSPEQKARAVKVLVAKLDEGKEPVATRAVIIQTLGELGDPAAHDVILRSTSDPEPVLRVQACRALGKVGRPEDSTVLTRVMATDTLEDCRIAAIEAIGNLKSTDPRISRVLVRAMHHDDPATRLASLNALRKITGRDLGVDAEAWAKILPADPTDESKTLMAGQSNAAAAPGATTASAPAYPPKPLQRRDPVIDTSTVPTGMPPIQDEPVSMESGSPKYPNHNPNIPAPTQPR